MRKKSYINNIVKKIDGEKVKEIEKIINQPRDLQLKKERQYYDEFSDLNFKRLLELDNIKKALNKSIKKNFKIKNWHRCVTFKYTDNPLSTKGSVKFIGQRFNFGEDIKEGEFSPFNALYFAEDRMTALMEKFGEFGETLEDATKHFLAKDESISFVRLSGTIESYIDFDDDACLESFVEILSSIKFSKDIIEKRKKIGVTSFETLKTIKELRDSVYDPDWRYVPNIQNIPANSQIFGHLVYLSGVEAIMYSSVKSGKKNIVLFPKIMADKSIIELSDESPQNIQIKRLIKETVKDCI